MEKRRAGQGAGERGLEGVSEPLIRHFPTFTRALKRSLDPNARSWLDGERGEQYAARVIERVIKRVTGELICDVLLDQENIDLIAVLPTGIFIVEVKHWTGSATLKDDVIFHGSRRPHRVHAQVERQRRKLIERTKLTQPIEGVIVLVDKGRLMVKGTATPGTTPVIRLEQLRRHLLGNRRSPRPQVLEPYEIAGIAATIRHGGPLAAVITE
jgi:hypothetical protein